MNNVALATTLNDPEGRLLEEIQNQGEFIKELYSGRVGVSITHKTLPQVIQALKAFNFNVFIEAENDNFGDGYRQALKTALSYKTKMIHLIDFDRCLHWTNRFPKEFYSVVDYNTNRFVLFTRTLRALETHPYTQQSTEAIVNKVTSQKAHKAIDIFSGAYGMDKTTAEILLLKSKRKDSGIYAEFVNIIMENKIPIENYDVEGLEWETPDRYQKEIQKEGYEKWLSDWQSLKEWQRRLDIVKNSLEVFL